MKASDSIGGVLYCNRWYAVVLTQGSTLKAEWAHATAKVAGSEIIKNVVLSGFFFYLYNELAFLVSLPPPPPPPPPTSPLLAPPRVAD